MHTIAVPEDRQKDTPDPRRWLALALLALAQFVVVLDASIMNIALPSIGKAFDTPTEDLSWVINAYVLTFGGFLLLGGRMADLLGRRRVFMAGLGLFGIASLAGGLSANEGQLIAARAAQGLGAAILAPSALALVTTIFREGSERNKALSVWGAVAGAGGVAGVLLGGVLTDAFGWEAVLLVNVPIAVVAVALSPHLIDESRARLAHRSFDLLGASSVTAGLALLVYGLVEAAEAGWTSATSLGAFAGSAALLAAFVGVERRAQAPLVPFGIFRLRSVTGANLAMVLTGAAMFGLFFILSIYMQQVLGYDALEAGLAQLPLALSLVVSASAASPLVERVGVKPVLLVGLGLFAAGLGWLSLIPADGAFVADLLGPSLLVGIGLGLAFVPVTIAAVSGVAAGEAGLASGLINTTQQIGGALGLAVLVAIATSRTESALETGAAAPIAATEGFQVALAAGAGITALALVAAAIALPGRRTEGRVPEPAAEQA
jgi:EmrB/QacA subfamily drug resistance transporter